MIASPEIDAVGRRRAGALSLRADQAALEAGKHVYANGRLTDTPEAVDWRYRQGEPARHRGWSAGPCQSC